MTDQNLLGALPDIADDESTTAAIAVGGRYFGRIDAPGDSDWIAIALQAGVTYTFNLGPGTANAGVPFDTTLGLYDASGTLLAFNDDVGQTFIFNPGIGGVANPWNTYSFIEFTPTTTGTYYLAASTFDAGPDSHVGDYVLSAFAGDLPGGNNTPAVLDVGGASVTSRLDQSGDTDGFSVATVAGEYYTASITQSGDFAQFLAPLLEARDADGLVIGSTTNFLGNLTAQVTFQATSSTTWLNVASEFPGFDIGQYSIHIEEASPVDAIEEPVDFLLPADVNVYFAEDVNVTNVLGESFLAPAWTPEELSAAWRTFQQYSEVVNITFTVVEDPSAAHLVMTKQPDSVIYEGSAWPAEWGNTEIDGVVYNIDLLTLYPDAPAMSQSIFAPGSFAEHVLLHELGHHMGLSHPHLEIDGGAYVPGLFWGQIEYGDFALGQGVYTGMSYIPGFKEKDGAPPDFATPLSVDFGSAASPMALDIAALQQIYGANTTTRTGDDTYVLPEENAAGTGYVAIWDNGGTDTIAAAATNTAGVTIDLRAASLDYDKLGGGAVSWALGVHGGFTIANGVVIENAIGAAGDDRLVGNEAANRLEGGGGNDELGGGAGDDWLFGGAGNDRLFGDVLPGRPSGIGFGSGLVVSSAGADNNALETAWDITNAFALFADPDVANSQTIPHVTIEGIGDGSMDIFKITLEKGATLTIDMDHTTGGFDAGVGITRDGLSFLATFNDGLVTAGAGGSVSQNDSFGTFTAWDGGTYYIVVRDALFPDVAVGQSYVLHVSAAATTDAIGSGAGNDYLDGGDGDDYLVGGLGNDTLDGGSGSDTAAYADSNARVVINLGLNYAAGGHATGDSFVSIENVTGSAFNDRLAGSAGANTLSGGDGNDYLRGEGGADFLDGGSGIDTASYEGSNGSVLINLGLNFAFGGHAQGDSFSSIENVIGSGFDDHIVGDGGANVLWGGNGNDHLSGNAGNDELFGGAGDDMLLGGNGDDTLTGGASSDVLVGGGDIDTASYADSNARVVINLGLNYATSGHAAGDSFISIENVIGSAFNDRIAGDGGANVLNGGEGNDYLRGEAGDDELLGGSGDDILLGSDGDDILIGGLGADLLDGGNGSDTASYEGSNARVVVNLGLGYAASGHAEGDSFVSIENVLGSAFNDRIAGDAGANILRGGAGNDYLRGEAGNDQLFGGSGEDLFAFGAGDGNDVIGDFVVGVDYLVLNGITIASTNELDGNTDTILDTLVTFSGGGTVLLASVTGITDPGDLIA